MKMETLTQVFSCEFCEIFKERFFKVHLLATTSVESLLKTSPLCSEEGKNEFSDYYIFWKENIFVAQHIFGFASSVKNLICSKSLVFHDSNLKFKLTGNHSLLGLW